MKRERHVRTVVKSITWRGLATLTAMLLVWLFIGDVTIALSVGIIEVLVKLIIYYAHERAWQRVPWGYDDD